ncbi:U3 snoRNP protein [Myotisia sp. PD_48]|nr:U3 snoRNP protein [Myotisia sp. PD_48]
MPGASDKARFYLEQLVPELKEYEKKKIFSKSEISSITIKRSDFEHRINDRGSQPSDYARYAEYEMNLDTLRKKRIKRLGVKSAAHTGQRRIFFILDRATRKFHGDISLWMQYIEYARKQRAHKKVSQIFTDALRLHPTQVELWICAGQYALQEHGDITQARAYMQRGLRFCKNSTSMWLQYAKLELIYIYKICERQRILGLDKSKEPSSTMNKSLGEPAINGTPPPLTEEDVNPDLADDTADQAALQTLSSTPALSGAIPITIFDAAMKQFGNDIGVAETFYALAAEFERIPCLQRILSHITNSMITNHPTNAAAQVCHIKCAVAGINPTSPEFPRALSTSLKRIREYMTEGNRDIKELAHGLIEWLRSLLSTESLDPALQKVIESTVWSTQSKIESSVV